MDSSAIDIAKYAATTSHWALYVSSASFVVAAGGLYLQFRRWMSEGVKLSLTANANMKIFGAAQKDPNTYISVSVANRGSAPTTITQMWLLHYPKSLARFVPGRIGRRIKFLRAENYYVNATGLPHSLAPGSYWTGMATQTTEVQAMIDVGRLYVAIVATHSSKPKYKVVRHGPRQKRG